MAERCAGNAARPSRRRGGARCRRVRRVDRDSRRRNHAARNRSTRRVGGAAGRRRARDRRRRQGRRPDRGPRDRGRFVRRPRDGGRRAAAPPGGRGRSGLRRHRCTRHRRRLRRRLHRDRGGFTRYRAAAQHGLRPQRPRLCEWGVGHLDRQLGGVRAALWHRGRFQHGARQRQRHPHAECGRRSARQPHHGAGRSRRLSGRPEPARASQRLLGQCA